MAHSELVPGGTASFVRAFPDRIHSAQLSDNRGRVDEHMTIGAGTIDFRRVLGALRRIHFAGPLIIELFDVPKKLREPPPAARAPRGGPAGGARAAATTARPARRAPTRGAPVPRGAR